MALITAVKNWMFNFTNFLMGHSVIFIVIFGWFLVITGLIFLAQPEKARKKLIAQGAGMIKGALTVAAIYLALLVLSLGGKVGTGLAGSISLAMVVVLVWAYFYLIKRSSEILTQKFALVPVSALKIYAIVQTAVGILMITLHKRIW
jgi:hypothetical protein